MGIQNRDYMREGRNRFMVAMHQVVPVLIAINVAIFVMWNVSGGAAVRFLFANFYSNWDLLAAGKVWTLWTAAFSHQGLWHLVLNMYALFIFGKALEADWGARRFLIFYLCAAPFSSLFGALLSEFVLDVNTPGLGASGAVSAVALAYALSYPNVRLLLFLLIPCPAIVAALLFVGFDLLGFMQQLMGHHSIQSKTRIGHGVHLGGALFGFLYFKYFLHGRGFGFQFRKSRRRGSRQKARIDVLPGVRDPFHTPDPDEQRLDQLLAKIQRGGLDSLTPEEREFMMEMSQRMRRDS